MEVAHGRRRSTLGILRHRLRKPPGITRGILFSLMDSKAPLQQSDEESYVVDDLCSPNLLVAAPPDAPCLLYTRPGFAQGVFQVCPADAWGNTASLKAHVAVLRLFVALSEHRLTKDVSLRLPDLQDPIALVEPLTACWAEGIEGTKDGASRSASRGVAHLLEAERLIESAAKGLPDVASIAGYRAAIEFAKHGPSSALQQLEAFLERCPSSIKGRALYARLVEMTLARCRARACRSPDDGRGTERDSPAHGDGGVHVLEVTYARALREWLEADSLEPRAILGLASLHSERSGATVGIVDAGFIVKTLVSQLETLGNPRPLPPCGTAQLPLGVHTTRAALALWGALADLLGTLRVRDVPVSLPGGGLDHSAPEAPRPGTLWDTLYGGDPPWGPTDFQLGGGLGEARRRDGWCVQEGNNAFPGAPTPHPLLCDVDKHLWEDVLVHPGSDTLLARGCARDRRSSDARRCCRCEVKATVVVTL